MQSFGNRTTKRTFLFGIEILFMCISLKLTLIETMPFETLIDIPDSLFSEIKLEIENIEDRSNTYKSERPSR